MSEVQSALFEKQKQKTPMVSSPMTIIMAKNMTALKQIKMKTEVKNLNFSRAITSVFARHNFYGGLESTVIYNDHAINAELVATIISIFSFSN